jgi:hypothetical protein
MTTHLINYNKAGFAAIGYSRKTDMLVSILATPEGGLCINSHSVSGLGIDCAFAAARQAVSVTSTNEHSIRQHLLSDFTAGYVRDNLIDWKKEVPVELDFKTAEEMIQHMTEQLFAGSHGTN